MSIILAMCLFSLSMSVSPGPVNLICLSSGVNHGFRQSMPFVSGATIGFTLLLLAVGLGIGSVGAQNPLFLQILSYGGSAFIAYMGYKTATSSADITVNSQSKPTFFQGFALQWINPKAWIACLAGVSAFGLAEAPLMLMVFVALYFMICYASIAGWALMGSKISKVLQTPTKLVIFNRLMGGCLIGVAGYLVLIQV
ncbi:MAG: LysE family translocator [Psychrosphaera sp.]|nr:LysE family translocator [Psychrosphaera sp.]